MWDMIEDYEELIEGLSKTFDSMQTNRSNEIMKALTLISSILLPLTFIASLYGMNFRFMPELEWQYGYLWAIGLMVASALLPMWYFRQRGWLK